MNIESSVVVPVAAKSVLFNAVLTVSAMMVITAVAAYHAMSLQFSGLGSLGLLVGLFATLFWVHRASQSGWGLVALAVMAGLLGMSLSSLLSYMEVTHGARVIRDVAALVAFTTFACGVYVRVSKKDFSAIRTTLFVGICLLVICSLVMLIYPIPFISLGLSAAGVLLFTGYLLLDFSDIASGRETNYIRAACGLYLSVFNLFVNLLQLVGHLVDSE